MRHLTTRPTPALVVAFIALFAAIGGFGYAAVKLRPNSVTTKIIRNGAITTGKIADGAVATPKLAPDAVAPSATSAAIALNAARLGGAAPGECQSGWLKAAAVVDTGGLTDEPSTVPGFSCASKAGDAIQIRRAGVGEYELALRGIDSATAIASSEGPNAVAAATRVQQGSLVVHVWDNLNAALTDNLTFTLLVF
jgi:hypothetical protein